MRHIKIYLPYRIKVKWFIDGELVKITKYFNESEPDDVAFDEIPVPDDIIGDVHVEVHGNCAGIDVSELQPKRIDEFGELGEDYEFAKVGNHNLVALPDHIPETFTTLADCLSGSDQLNCRNVEKWDTANILDIHGAFAGCSSFNRNLTCWDMHNIVDPQDDAFDGTAISEHRKPLWGQDGNDSTGRSGLPCTPIDLQIIGSSTTIPNQLTVFEAATVADLEPGSMDWEVVPLTATEIEKLSLSEQVIAINAMGTGRALVRTNYDDGEYTSTNLAAVDIIDNIVVRTQPVINSLGCGAMIFITADVEGIEDHSVEWIQISGPVVEIDNANSLTMGFVRPTTGLSSSAEEYVFRLQIAANSVVARTIDVRVSSAPTTILTKLTNDPFVPEITHTDTIQSEVIRFEPNGRDGIGCLMEIRPSTSYNWMHAIVYEVVNGEHVPYATIYDNTRMAEILTPETGIYTISDFFISDRVRVPYTITEKKLGTYFTLGVKHGTYLQYINSAIKHPSKVIHAESVIQINEINNVTSKVPLIHTFSDYRRSVLLLDPIYVEHTIANSVIDVVYGDELLLDVIDNNPEVDSTQTQITPLMSSVMNQTLNRFDIRYVAG